MLANVLRDLVQQGSRPRATEAKGRLTVGMAAYGNARITDFALKCLFSSLRGDFELILVDDNSPDDTLDVFASAARRHGNAKLFHFPENKEYSGSLNAILCHASRPYILFLSNDIFVTPSYICALMSAAEADPRHGIVRGVSNFCDDRSPLHNVPAPAACDQDMGTLFRFAADHQRKHGRATAESPFLTGDAFLVRSTVLERIGGIDTSFFGYFADIDFGIRAQIAGFRQMTALGGFAFHLQNANFRYLPAEEAREKARRRTERLRAAWTTFHAKYSPALGNGSWARVSDLPWERLRGERFSIGRHFVPPADYSEYRLL